MNPLDLVEALKEPMQKYPSIDGHIVDTRIKMYPKYDGINTRVKWTRKRGFSDFGTRHRLVEASEPILGQCVGLWRQKYEAEVTEILMKKGCRQAVLFGEMFGPTSFAGHFTPNEPLDVILYDALLDDGNLLIQKEFARLFQGVEIAPIIYEGNPTDPIREQVKQGLFEGQTFEGVICKGPLDSRGRPIMFKIKSDAWYDRLRLYCQGDQSLFDSLA